ncbi:MAG: cytochrome c oxidase subunit 3 [Terracidiphilus sp.]
MPAIIVHKPEKKRAEPGVGGQPPVIRRPTGGGGDGGGDDHEKGGRGEPRRLLLRIRSVVFLALAADLAVFAILVAILCARQTGAPSGAAIFRSGPGWQVGMLPPILYLNTLVLLLSSLTMEIARRNIFREMDVLEEWLGLGRPALARTLPWLGVTLALGALFLAGQWTAWKQLTALGFRLRLFSPRGSFFYLVTGLHAAHLLLGVMALVACLSLLGWLKRVELRQIAVDATAWYWHTMSLAWLLLLGVLALG